MTLIQPILIAFMIVGVVAYFRWLRSSHWDRAIVLFLGLVGVVLVAAPDLANWLAMAVGVGRGADLVTYIGVVGLSFFCLVLLSRLRELESRLADLTRQLALDEAVQPEDPEPRA